MTNERYKAMIEASGGFTPQTRRAGDRPQPLADGDETALSRAWETVSESVNSTSARSLQKAEPTQEKRSA